MTFELWVTFEFCVTFELWMTHELWVTFKLWVTLELWLTLESWVAFELEVTFQLWMRGGQTHKHTHRHINTMTGPGLRAGQSENLLDLVCANHKEI